MRIFSPGYILKAWYYYRTAVFKDRCVFLSRSPPVFDRSSSLVSFISFWISQIRQSQALVFFFGFFFAPDKGVPLEFELRAGKEHLAQSSCRSLVHWHAIFPSVSTRACNSHAIKKKTESERNEAVLLIPQRRRQSKTKDGGDGP